MAQRTLVRLVDDIDGKELKAGTGETVKFALDGAAYEIDLSARNAKALRSAFAPYVEAGRRTGRTSVQGAASSRGGPTRRDPAQTKAIRAWAKSNGHTLSDRGRISSEVEAAYEAAH